MIEILQEYMFLRTYRTDSLRKVMYYIQPLVEEVARRTELTKEEVAYMTKEEIKEFLLENKTPDKKLIRERIKHCLLLRTKNLNLIVSDKKGIGKIINKELGKKRTEVKKVKGSIACRGIAMGKVRIIKSPKDLEKLKKGDILVTSMTSPDMTIAIRKAGAIVTDEGGITCHAAIVSREMNTPCVIGTEKATKVFKNGDLIVVDAENGIVEKVKK
jgi:pyruvate,water dikinase